MGGRAVDLARRIYRLEAVVKANAPYCGTRVVP